MTQRREDLQHVLMNQTLGDEEEKSQRSSGPAFHLLQSVVGFPGLTCSQSHKPHQTYVLIFGRKVSHAVDSHHHLALCRLFNHLVLRTLLKNSTSGMQIRDVAHRCGVQHRSEVPRYMKNYIPVFIAYMHILGVLGLIAALNKLHDPLSYILSRYRKSSWLRIKTDPQLCKYLEYPIIRGCKS